MASTTKIEWTDASTLDGQTWQQFPKQLNKGEVR